MHDNITLNGCIYVCIWVKIAGPTNYKQTRAWRYIFMYVVVCILYSMSLCTPVDEYIYPICRATEPYTSGACTFNVPLLMQCLQPLHCVCQSHIQCHTIYAYYARTRTHTHAHAYTFWIYMHDQYYHNIPCDRTTWCEEKDGRCCVHAVTCNQLRQWVQRGRRTPQIISWRELVIIQILVKTTFLWCYV